MKIRKKKQEKIAPDMTPMIDMTFQLIAFFMVLVNFTEADQDARIKLPQSILAKPPEGPIEHAYYIHMTPQGTAIYTGEEVTIKKLKSILKRERQALALDNVEASAATVIIRADAASPTGEVQGLIQA